MDWYPVIKHIKGHGYLYVQVSWRESGRKNPCTASVYVGRADEAGNWLRTKAVAVALVRQRRRDRQSGVVRGRAGRRQHVGERRASGNAGEMQRDWASPEEKAFIENEVFSGSTAAWQPSWSWVGRGKRSVAALPDPEVLSLPGRMGVAVVTQIGMTGDWRRLLPPEQQQIDGPAYHNGKHRIYMPPGNRFGGSGAAYTHALLHELAHATKVGVQRPRTQSRAEYAREELVAETAALLVMRRLGLEIDAIEQSRHYIAHWQRQAAGTFTGDAATAAAWAQREAVRAADYIMARHSRGGWQPRPSPIETEVTSGAGAQ